MPLWSIILGSLLLFLGVMWLVMERIPHHQFIDACGSDNLTKLKQELEKPQELNKPGWFGLTPLGEAIRNQKIENVKLIIEAGALLAIPGARQTHLHTAVQEGTTEIVEVMLKSGADPNAKNYVGESLLQLAAEDGQVETVRLLLQHGADPNSDNGLPDHPGEPLIIVLVALAAKNQKPEPLEKLLKIIGLMLDAGANINARSQGGAPLVGLALADPRVLKFLVDRGAITDVAWDGDNLQETIASILESAAK